MHKSALIWVNSSKVLPFEREEKKKGKSDAEEHFTLVDIAADEDLTSDQELEDAIQAMGKQREPKDAKGRIKKSNVPANQSAKRVNVVNIT